MKCQQVSVKRTSWGFVLIVALSATSPTVLGRSQEEAPYQIPLSELQKILNTQVASSYRGNESLWAESTQHAWAQARKTDDDESPLNPNEHNSTRRKSRRSLTSEASVPLVVCDMTRNKSGAACVKTIQKSLQTTAVVGIYNKDDMTCVVAVVSTATAFPTVDTMSLLNLRAIPLTPELKMAPKLAEKISSRTLELRRVEAVYCPIWPVQGQLRDKSSTAADVVQSLLHGMDRRRLGEALVQKPWDRVLEDSQTPMDGCLKWVGSFHINASPEVILWNIPEGDMDARTRSLCLQSMVLHLSLSRKICAVDVVPQITPFNSLASQIIQNGEIRDEHPLFDVGLNGTNQIVALSDTGLDVNNCYFHDDTESVSYSVSGHLVNFNHRKVVQYCTWKDDKDTLEGHGTHVAGSIAGHASEMGGAGDGMAPGAKLAFFDLAEGSEMASPGVSEILEAGYVNANAKIHSISWGTAGTSEYSGSDLSADIFMYLNPDFLVVASAGNDGFEDAAMTLGSPAQNKNGVTVGASLNAFPHIHEHQSGPDLLADFSSRGPTADGRRKPDVTAPGMFVRSARAVPDTIGECDNTNDSGLLFRAGTSMSAPIVAGAAAVIRQYFEEGWHVAGRRNLEQGMSPRASLVKAILVNGATALSGVDKNAAGVEASETIPYDNNQGFGRINLLSSLPIAGKNEFVAHFVNAQQIDTGGQVNYAIKIDDTLALSCTDTPLSATLAWTDPPVSVFCSGSCVLNDLDLEIVDDETGKVFFPNGLDGKDDMNNLERVRIQQPQAGATYRVQVKGSQQIEPQDYSLVISGCFHLVETVQPTVTPRTSPPTTAIPSPVPMTNPPSLFDVVTARPTTIPKDPCQDFTGEIALDADAPKTCDWLFNNQDLFNFFCKFWDVVQFCPLTCDACQVFEEQLEEDTQVTDVFLKGDVRYEGIEFTVQANEKDIVVQGWGLHLRGLSDYSVDVYTRADAEAEWQLMCQSQVKGAGRHSLTRIEGGDCTAVKIHAQNEAPRRFYITLNGSQDLIMSSGNPNDDDAIISDTDVSIALGSAVTHADGTQFEGYGFDGVMRYRRWLDTPPRPCHQEDDGNVVLVDTTSTLVAGQRSCAWLQENWQRFGHHICQLAEPAQQCPVVCGTPCE